MSDFDIWNIFSFWRQINCIVQSILAICLFCEDNKSLCQNESIDWHAIYCRVHVREPQRIMPCGSVCVNNIANLFCCVCNKFFKVCDSVM